MSIKWFAVHEQRGDKMGIGKGITDFLGAFAESAMGSDSKGAGVPTGSGSSKSSDSHGGNSGSSNMDSAGITETRDSWGNPTSHSVETGGVDKIYPAGMMGFIGALTGGQPVATIERVGDRSIYKDSNGDTIASGIRQSDGSERVYDGSGTFVREVTPAETHNLPDNNCVDRENGETDDSESNDDNSEDDTGNAYAEGKERGRNDALENRKYANNDDQSQQYCDGYYDGWQQTWFEIGERNCGSIAGRNDAYENLEYANNDDKSQQYSDGYYDGWQQAWYEIGDKNTGCKAGYHDAYEGNEYADNDDKSQQYSDGYYDGWQYALEEIRENEENDLLENWAVDILAA